MIINQDFVNVNSNGKTKINMHKDSAQNLIEKLVSLRMSIL